VKKYLHVICHDIPYPANYGGVVDMFCKIKALHQKGIGIHLHCFEYGGRTPQPELNQYCESVTYYPRKKRISWRLPYIVSSRKNEALLTNLLKDDYPVLMESLHCSWPLMDQRFASRKMVLRVLNVEWQYYSGLARSTRNWWRKAYYLVESRLLRRYEARIAAKAPILTIGVEDARYFTEVLGAPQAHYLPAFVPYSEVKAPGERGSFCLYHGNLSVPENEMAATWLLKYVFSDIDIPFVIAGRNPSKKLEHLAHQNLNTCIAANPSEKEMKDLIAKAQLTILPAFNATGVKLKVLESLYTGRFCITNDNARKGFHDDGLLIIAEDATAMKQSIQKWFHQPFTGEQAAHRNDVLHREFDNSRNADALIQYLW
jgi:hypothetical protein